MQKGQLEGQNPYTTSQSGEQYGQAQQPYYPYQPQPTYQPYPLPGYQQYQYSQYQQMSEEEQKLFQQWKADEKEKRKLPTKRGQDRYEDDQNNEEIYNTPSKKQALPTNDLPRGNQVEQAIAEMWDGRNDGIRQVMIEMGQGHEKSLRKLGDVSDATKEAMKKNIIITLQERVVTNPLGQTEKEFCTTINNFMKRFGLKQLNSDDILPATNTSKKKWSLQTYRAGTFRAADLNVATRLMLLLLTDSRRDKEAFEEVYQHDPQVVAGKLTSSPSPQGRSNTTHTKKGKCRYGATCYSKGCRFEHPQNLSTTFDSVSKTDLVPVRNNSFHDNYGLQRFDITQGYPNRGRSGRGGRTRFTGSRTEYSNRGRVKAEEKIRNDRRSYSQSTYKQQAYNRSEPGRDNHYQDKNSPRMPNSEEEQHNFSGPPQMKLEEATSQNEESEMPRSTEGRRQKEILDAIEAEEKIRKEKAEKEEKEKRRKEKEELERKQQEEAKAQEEKEKKEQEAKETLQKQQRNHDKMISTLVLDMGEEETMTHVTTKVLKHQWITLQEYAKDEIPPEHYDILYNSLTKEQKEEQKPRLSLNVSKISEEEKNKMFGHTEYWNKEEEDKELIFVPHSATARVILAKILEGKFPEDVHVPKSPDANRKKIEFNTEEMIQIAQEVTKNFWLSCLINERILQKELRTIRQYTANRNIRVQTYMKKAIDSWNTADMKQNIEAVFGDVT